MKVKRFELDPQVSLGCAFARVWRTEMERVQTAWADRSGAPEEAVHEFRKSMKRLRGLLRLASSDLGSDYKRLNRELRDAARELSSVRDRTAVFETVEKLHQLTRSEEEEEAVSEARERLELALAKTLDRQAVEERMNLALERSRKAVRLLEGKEIESTKTVGCGLERVYRKARKQLKTAASREDDALHELRKSVKYHRYHLRLLRPSYRELLSAERRAAKDASNLLGEDHDLVVLRDHLVDLKVTSETQRVLGRLMEERRHSLQGWAFYLLRRVLQEKPKRRRLRLQTYFERALEEGAATREQNDT